MYVIIAFLTPLDCNEIDGWFCWYVDNKTVITFSDVGNGSNVIYIQLDHDIPCNIVDYGWGSECACYFFVMYQRFF